MNRSSFLEWLYQGPRTPLVWVPVMLGLGIGILFWPPFGGSCLKIWSQWQLGFWDLLSLMALSLGLLFVPRSWNGWWIPRALGFLLLGVMLGFRAILYPDVGTAFLEKRVGPVTLQGTIERVSLLPKSERKGGAKIVLKNLHIEDAGQISNKKKIVTWPQKLRLHVPSVHLPPTPLHEGEEVQVRAKLTPLPGPALPGGYDMRRRAYFEGIGASGFTFAPLKLLPSSADEGTLAKVRREITARLLQDLPDPEGAIAAALITGETSAIPSSVRQAYANAGIAHILAISGLHLSLIAAFIFFLVRRLFILFGPLIFRISTKKVAAVIAVIATAGYLVLSGFGIPAQRAFIMTSLVFLGILLDREVLSLRSLAIAATGILIWSPQVLIGPSFQLSFAAVTALIAAYQSQWGRQFMEPSIITPSLWSRSWRFMRNILITTLIATLATTPFTMAFFHKFTLQGWVGNLIGIPLTGFWILPSAFLTVLLVPFGGEQLVLPILSKGISLLTYMAIQISQWPGADLRVPHFSDAFIPLVVIGGVLLCLMQGKSRLLGMPFLLGAGVLGFEPPKEAFLISQSGQLQGKYSHGTLFLSSLRKERFVADRWAEAYGVEERIEAPQGAIPGVTIDQKDCNAAINLFTRRSEKEEICPPPTLTFDRLFLWLHGSVQVSDGLVHTAQEGQGFYPWGPSRGFSAPSS